MYYGVAVLQKNVLRSIWFLDAVPRVATRGKHHHIASLVFISCNISMGWMLFASMSVMFLEVTSCWNCLGYLQQLIQSH